jgi:serine/threonine protein kinase
MLLVPETYGLTRGTPAFDRVAAELLREARLLHSLRHENIVQLRGVTMHPEHGHVQWLVTELADGGSLEKWVTARGRMTPRSCWTCCAASCERWCTCTAARRR